jgi:hypothetical protein
MVKDKDWQIATVTDGPYKGEDVAILTSAYGYCMCELSAKVNEHGEYVADGYVVVVPEKNLRFWVKVKSIFGDGAYMDLAGKVYDPQFEEWFKEQCPGTRNEVLEDLMRKSWYAGRQHQSRLQEKSNAK